MDESKLKRDVIRVADLKTSRPTPFDITPDKASLDQIAAELDLQGLRKLRFEGAIEAEGKTDWRLEARLGATAVQTCVVTLAPVTTRVDDTVIRRFLVDMPDLPQQADDEIEMPEDDTLEPLRPEIDLTRVMIEALALALPDYPRAPGAALEQTDFAAPGVTPMTEDDAKPFAGLASLRDKLKNEE